MSDNKPASTLLAPSRRTLVGGLGALAVAGEFDLAQAAEEDAGKIWGVYCGKDMKSYLCELTSGASVPVYRGFITPPAPAPSWQDAHVSSFWGGVTMIMQGELEIGVTGGATKTALGKAGDIFVLIDTQGDGHTAARKGKVPLVTVQARLKEPWTAIKKM
jgi:hypothetical protein